MSAETDIYAALSAGAALAVLVSERIYPDAIPEKDPLPAVVYMRAGGERFYGLDNSLHAERVRLRIVAWGEGRDQALQVGEAIAAALAAAGYPIEPPDADFAAEVGESAAVIETDWWD